MVELFLYLLPALFSMGFVAVPMGQAALHSLDFGALVLLLVWFFGAEVVALLWPHTERSSVRGDGARKIALGASLVVTLGVMAGAIILLHPRIIALQYILTLGYLALRFLIVRTPKRNLPLCATVTFLALWLSGCVTFSVATKAMQWQSILLVGGIAGVTTAGVITQYRALLKSDPLFERIVTLGILAAPMATSLLVFSHQLSSSFLLLLFLTPLASPLAARARNTNRSVSFAGLLIPVLVGVATCALTALP